MSQHEPAFLADSSGDIARVARRVLSVVAAKADDRTVNSTLFDGGRDLETLYQRTYDAAFSIDPRRYNEVVDEAQQCGYDNDYLAYDLIPRVARQLGAAWEDDLISFSDVTIGCGRLQSLLRRLPDDTSARPSSLRSLDCLVVVQHGTQHTLGASVLARQLRQANHRVKVNLEASKLGLREMARGQNFDVVMISAAQGQCPEGLRSLIRHIRPLWPNSRIIVGGSVIEQQGYDLDRFGADQVSNDWRATLNHFF